MIDTYDKIGLTILALIMLWIGAMLAGVVGVITFLDVIMVTITLAIGLFFLAILCATVKLILLKNENEESRV